MRSILDSVIDHIRDLPPYQAGRPISAVAREFGLDPSQIVKLASNENPHGMAPAAKARLQHLADDHSRYPDSGSFELRAALSAHLALDPAWILPGAGSSELIAVAARAFLGPGRNAVISQYAFLSYSLAVRMAGAQVLLVPARDFGHDLDAMAAAVTGETKLLFIATPNNPTGTCSDPRELERVLDALPATVLVILDEAYRDYLDAGRQPDVPALLARHPNLLVLRTFSKVYGLAGFRVGYALGAPAVLDILKRLQPPFSVSTLAQAAAVAALGDADFVRQSVTTNQRERERLAAALTALGLAPLASHGNFLLVRVGGGDAIARALLERGIIVRPVTAYGLSEWIRVTVGLPEENRRFIEAMTQVMNVPATAAD